MQEARATVSQRQDPHIFTFSPKVFLPITRLCRDSCAYCTFAQPPRAHQRAYMTPDEVLATAAAGAKAGCTEALFTLGDKPELAYAEALEELERLGFPSTVAYVAHLCELVLTRTGLLPHVNCGVVSRVELAALRRVSVSQGLMLESSAPQLMQPGGAHHDCPDKDPALRLQVLEDAGQLRIPMTSGLLIGIGETPEDRLRDLLTLRDLHRRHGHLQELIIQNFVPKPNTGMENARPAPAEQHLQTIALARVIFGPDMNLQAPPNLSAAALALERAEDVAASWRNLIDAGINDWGGVSPVTRDHVNPERPWPHLEDLATACASRSKLLLPRLPVYPEYVDSLSRRNEWLDARPIAPGAPATWERNPALPFALTPAATAQSAVLAHSDATGLARFSGWFAGAGEESLAQELSRHLSEEQGALVDELAVEEAQLSSELRADGASCSDDDEEATGESLLSRPPSDNLDDDDAEFDSDDVADARASSSETEELATDLHVALWRGVGHGKAPVVPRGRSRAKWQVQLDWDGALSHAAERCEAPDVTPAVARVLQKLQRFHERCFCAADVGTPDRSASSKPKVQEADIEAEDICVLLRARGADARAVMQAAQELTQRVHGGQVSYVVNRNINYTNLCTYQCGFCAFSKGAPESARDAPYLLDLGEIQRRVAEAWDRGATEVCLQGGIHPDFTGSTYLDILQACKEAAPDIHVHAFSPLEVFHGASTLGLSTRKFLERLRQAGLGSLPGTAAEVLTDRVRGVICPDKLSADEWCRVIGDAHAAGLRTTSTIMFGHVDGLQDWAEHFTRLRSLQARTGGITEFVPLPFVHMDAPMFRKGRSRRGPTLHEAIIIHSVARLVLYPWIQNIQASWVKMGPIWSQRLLQCGCNDMGGSLMNESITRAAGANYGQELSPSDMEHYIHAADQSPWQRTTLYAPAPQEQIQKSFTAPELLMPSLVTSSIEGIQRM